MTTRVHVGEADGLRTLCLEGPPANALSGATMAALVAACDAPPPAVGIVLTGSGAMFTGGMDVKMVAATPVSQRAALVHGLNTMCQALYRLPVPVVAALGGHSIGAGIILQLACDWRLCAAGPHKLGLTEARAGLPFPAGALAILQAEADPAVARRLAISSRIVGPEEALALRLIDEIVEPDALLNTAASRVRALAAQPGFAVVKAQLRAATQARLDALVASGDDPLIATLRKA